LFNAIQDNILVGCFISHRAVKFNIQTLNQVVSIKNWNKNLETVKNKQSGLSNPIASCKKKKSHSITRQKNKIHFVSTRLDFIFHSPAQYEYFSSEKNEVNVWDLADAARYREPTQFQNGRSSFQLPKNPAR
jgi:hypothetical protein